MERHHKKTKHTTTFDFDNICEVKCDRKGEKKCETKCNHKCDDKCKKCSHKCDKKCEKKCRHKCDDKCNKCYHKCDDKCCKKKCKPKKCSSSSSSSSSCSDPCVPRVVYVACVNGGQASLGLTAVVTTPNGNLTYTCPTQIGQSIYIQFTVTNTGNVSIKSPIYVYSTVTGVHRITCKKLAPGATVTKTVHFKITKCECVAGNTIPIVANAYTYLHGNCLILVSQPLGIVLTQA